MKKLLITCCTSVVLICWGFVVYLIQHENMVSEIERLRAEADPGTLAERESKADEIGQKVYERYANLDYLSYRSSIHSRWYKHDSFRRKLPLRLWKHNREAANVIMRQTPHSFTATVFVKGNPLYRFFLKDGTYKEFKWPYKGIEGMLTTYAPIGTYTRLRRGVEPYLLCRIGQYICPEIGEDSHRPAQRRDLIGRGVWIGTSQAPGEACDVILLDRNDPDDHRVDVFYVNREGFIRMWSIRVHLQGKHNDRYIETMHFTRLSTEPIADDVFTPPKQLLEETKGWETLSDAESKALRD